MTGGGSEDWLTRIAGADLDRLFVWEAPRPVHFPPPGRRPNPRRLHAKRYLWVLRELAAADRTVPPPRWRPLPDPPQEWRCTAGEPDPDDYVLIRGVLQRNPGRWAVVFVGDRAGAGQVQQRLQFHLGGFDVRVRAAGGGLFQAHARYGPPVAR